LHTILYFNCKHFLFCIHVKRFRGFLNFNENRFRWRLIFLILIIHIYRFSLKISDRNSISKSRHDFRLFDGSPNGLANTRKQTINIFPLHKNIYSDLFFSFNYCLVHGKKLSDLYYFSILKALNYNS